MLHGENESPSSGSSPHKQMCGKIVRFNPVKGVKKKKKKTDGMQTKPEKLARSAGSGATVNMSHKPQHLKERVFPSPYPYTPSPSARKN